MIEHWPEFAGSWWISDDQEALRFARFRGITTRETIDLVDVAVINGDIAARDGFDLLMKMADSGRFSSCRVRRGFAAMSQVAL